MTEYDIAGPTRVCAATGRPLQPGDRYYAVLTGRDGEFVRADYAADAWPGPPPGYLAYWAGTVPPAEKPRRPAVDDDALVGCFDRLAAAGDGDGRNFRYVAALLLMRRKRFRFEDAIRDDAGSDVLLVRDTRTGTVHRVPDPRLADDQAAAVQAELFRVLGWE
ncbi:MAG: hypothetical protein K2X87_23915 [Gemmataceae bacterium]|nr:hypothetical protein [Gemmataceae bacterium]